MVEVYIHGKGYFATPSDTEEKIPDSPEELKAAIDEIDNAIAHLERSNKEMQQFDPDGRDPDLVQAIHENVDAMAIKRDRRQRYEDKLRELCPNICSVKEDPAAAASSSSDQPGLSL